MNTLKKILFMLTLSGAQKGAQSGVASAVDWFFLGFNKEKTPWTLQNPRRFFIFDFDFARRILDGIFFAKSKVYCNSFYKNAKKERQSAKNEKVKL